MRVSHEFGSYNRRRYSKPWIYKITAWPVGQDPLIQWGAYIGDDSGGEVEIEACADDVVRAGQKDGRGHKGMAEWFIVQHDGSLARTTPAAARKHWQATHVSEGVEK